MKSFFRINALLWADILAGFPLFVMQSYLTDVWKLSFTRAAAYLNIWNGIFLVLPAFFQFLVDAFLGNFMMLVISSIAYSVGLGFVTLSSQPVLANSTGIGHAQKVLFHTGMALIGVGVSGHTVSVVDFVEEQKEQEDNVSPDDNAIIKLLLKFLGYALVIVIVFVVGAVVIAYIKSWTLRFGIPAICTAVATLSFLSGWCTYNNVKPQGSPITSVCRVFVATASKKSQPFPLDSKQLYQKDEKELQSLSHTRFLRCLEKAAIILPDVSLEDQVDNRWKLCSIAEVEAAKFVVRMVPMSITFIICGFVSSIGNTYFIEQANHMNHKIGKWKVPLLVLPLPFFCARKLFDALAVYLLKKLKDYYILKKSNNCGPPIGIAVAMIFSVLCCITAARTEERRLKVIRSHGLLDKPEEDIPMSVSWLLFQFFLLAGLDSFLEKSLDAFYEDQAPQSMKKYLVHFTNAVSGLGVICGVLSVYVVGKISEIGGKTNWFQYTLNKSRLDRYYWVLAALSSVNLFVFILVASCYRYKDQEEPDNEVVDTGGSASPSNGNVDVQ